jgi:hypothetical protein
MKKAFKYLFITFGFVLLFLIITNPSLKQFKEHIGITKEKYYDLTFRRTNNYIIFSKYQFSYSRAADDDNVDYNQDIIYSKGRALDELEGHYIGLFSNFILIKRH